MERHGTRTHNPLLAMGTLTTLCAGAVALSSLAATACSSGSPLNVPTAIPSPTSSGKGSVSDAGAKPDSASTAPPPSKDSGAGTATDTGAGTTEDSSPPPATSVTISADATWADGQQISQSTIIAADVTVTISPGASVTFAPGTSLTIDGTLTASSATPTHATFAGASGSWVGLIVGAGGTLSLDGVDIKDATSPIETKSGNAAASYDDGTITGAQSPFTLDTGSTLTTDHATVTGTTGESGVKGAFTATFLSYQKGGTDGIIMEDPTATMSIQDSTLTGTGPSGDMVVSAVGSQLSISYSTITNVHCAFHFDAINAFSISYVTANMNAWGAMLYGSTPGAGPYTIESSNFAQDSDYALDEEGSNGTITVTGCYIAGQDTGVTATNPVSAPIAAAAPRSM